MQLYDKATKRVLGEISITQFVFLQSKLLADRPNDTDYYIDKDKIDMLKGSSGDEGLVSKPHTMLGNEKGIELNGQR